MKLIQDGQENEIAWARNVAEFLRAHNDEFNAKLVDDAIQMFAQRRIVVAVVGLNKRGKSTFCNAWLGRSDDTLAPVDHLPATGVVSLFRATSEKHGVQVIFLDGAERDITENEIRNYVSETCNPQNQKSVKQLIVKGDFDLDPEADLMDMPGDDSIYASHSEVVYEYLPRADVILFLSSADDPIKQSELKLLKKINPEEHKKIFFIVNKTDLCDEEELEDALNQDREVLTKAGFKYENRIYKISAKEMMELQLDRFDFLLLLDDIKKFLNEQKLELQRQGFRNAVRQAAVPVLNAMRFAENSAKLSQEQLEDQLKYCREQNSELDNKLRYTLDEFRKKWGNAISSYEQQLPELEGRVLERTQKYIQEIPMMSITKKTLQTLPDKITEIMESEMHQAGAGIEGNLKNILQELNENMPSLSQYLADSPHRIKVVSSSASYLGSGVAGGVCIALGSGLAAINSAAIGAGASVPLIGSILSVIGGVATAPLMLLAMPLFAGGTIFCALPLYGWVRGKQRQKTEVINEAAASIKAAFYHLREVKLNSLREQGKRLAETLKENMENQKKLLADQLEALLAQRGKMLPQDIDSAQLDVDKLQKMLDQTEA